MVSGTTCLLCTVDYTVTHLSLFLYIFEVAAVYATNIEYK